MNKSTRALSALPLLLLAACVQTPQDDGYAYLVNSRPVCITVQDGPQTLKVRSTFSGDISPWKDGTLCDRLTSSGDSATYRGYIRYADGSDIFVFDAPSGSFHGSSPSVHSWAVPEEQTGQGVQPLRWAHVKSGEIAADVDGALSCQATLQPFSATAAVDVDSSLHVTRLDLESEGVCGEVYVNPAGQAGVSLTYCAVDAAFLTPGARSSSISVRKTDGVLSGRVLFSICPDAYDPVSGKYRHAADSVTLVLVNSSLKQATVRVPCPATDTSVLTLPAQMEFVSPKPTGRLVIVEDVDGLRISVADAPKGCRFFYETGTASVFDPSVLSDEFDGTRGFLVQTSDPFVSLLLKVLVHDDTGLYADLVLDGYVRNWNVVEGAAIMDAYNDYKTLRTSASLLAGDSIESTDGLTVTAKESGDGDITSYYDHSILRNSYPGCKVVNAGADCAVRYETSGPAGTRATLTKDGRDVESWSVTGDGTCPFVSTPDTSLSEVAAGTMLSVVPSGAEAVVRSLSVLETGDNLSLPEAPKMDVHPTFKFSGTATEPTLILDTEAIGDTLMREVTFTYTASATGFEDAGIPTAESTPFTAMTQLTAADKATKHDELYVVVLATGAHYNATLTRIHLRTWHFGWDFEPDSKPKSGTSYTFYKANTDYYGLTYTQPIGVVSSYGSRAQFKNNCTITAKALHGGSVISCAGCYKADAAATGQGIHFYAGEQDLGAIVHGAVAYNLTTTFVMFTSPAAATGVNAGDDLVIKTGSCWYQFAPIAFAEIFHE